jgi:hypothetical protein
MSVIEIDISVQNNTLVVGVNGGNVTAAPGDTVLWRAADGVDLFTLQFFSLVPEPAANEECEEIVVADQPRWPFKGEPPGNGIVGPTQAFEGILTGASTPAMAFKYCVTVGNLQIDPVVIVDR